ncbi:MAG: tetratricopeptide repeat protein [Planctomycetaceae bacterium]
MDQHEPESGQLPPAQADPEEFADELHDVSDAPLTGETVSFTGTLASMTHRDAMNYVEIHGGRASVTVNNSTTLLVIGEEGWPLEENGQASQKVQQAAQRIADGQSLRIIAESDLLQILGLDERHDEIQRSHTPAMLSRLLELPVGTIRRWARIGLIRPVRRVCRLPYFDYREVTGAKRLASLLDQGVPASTLERSLSELGKTLNSDGRSLAQLNLLVQDNTVVVRDAVGMLLPATGQRLLDFDSATQLRVYRRKDSDTDCVETEQMTAEPQDVLSVQQNDLTQSGRTMAEWNAEEWFNEGCRQAEDGELESAINSLRNSLSLIGIHRQSLHLDLPTSEQIPAALPDPADINFHLADALYRSGRTEAAVERYHCAIESAPDFVEAWTQLGCLQAELGNHEIAEQSLAAALQIHPGNPDALLHFALLLDKTRRAEQAATYWKQYLRHDSRGPWAEHARERLGLADPAVHAVLTTEPG